MKIGDLILIQKNDDVYNNCNEIGGMIVDYNAYNKHIGEYVIEWFDGQRTIEFDEEVQMWRNNFVQIYGLNLKGKNEKAQ